MIQALSDIRKSYRRCQPCDAAFRVPVVSEGLRNTESKARVVANLLSADAFPLIPEVVVHFD
jgi:hypothetical protein